VRICIYGAGAIGGYLAGFLAQSGAQVSVVARGPHLDAIRENGLTVESPDMAMTVKLRASADPAELGKQDAVIVTVKAPSLPGIAATLAPLLEEETPVVFLTNGIPWWYFHGHGGALDGHRLTALDPDDGLWKATGPKRLVGGIVWPASSVPAPGRVRLLAGHSKGTILGAPDGREMPGMLAIAAAFRSAGLPVTISDNIRDLIWDKLAFNLSAGPFCVLTEQPVRVVQEEDACVAASRAVMAEISAVIAAMGRNVHLDPDDVVSKNATLGHRPSILQDLMAKRPMEIDALYATPLEMARLAGAPTPTLDLLVALIKLRARSAGLYGA
jgi:2-dehydropantoate 2-reductase